MKKLSFIILFLAIAAAAIAKVPSAKKNSKEITSVTIYRTACFGRCPEYKITLDKYGLVTYTGIRFVPDSGVYTKKLGKAKAKEVINEFSAARVDTCQKTYESRIQDIPGLVMTIKYGKTTKTINNAHFGPGMLKRLARLMDDLLEQKHDDAGLLPLDKSWHKVTPKRK